ncbi:unnamed protein product [Euphydryas editha]|uniref:Uncharacterized protein n=1 Tax=Euphydryas editha TaxID=104508 RepID=A0AAU9TW47_EUPED|nr:unnamed protein product [Euphydryas editha]
MPRYVCCVRGCPVVANDASNKSPLAPDFQPFQEATLLNPIVTPSCSIAPIINPLVGSKPTTSRDDVLLHAKPRKPVEYSSSATFLKQNYEKKELKKNGAKTSSCTEDHASCGVWTHITLTSH